MEKIYENASHLTVYLNQDKKYIMFKWKKFGIPLEDLKVAHQNALNTAQGHSITSYIAETSETTGTLLPKILEWWEKTWVPKLQASIIKKIITIVPQSTLASFSTKDWQAVDFGGIRLQNCKTLKQAEKLV